MAEEKSTAPTKAEKAAAKEAEAQAEAEDAALNPSAEQKLSDEEPETPSGLALKKVGDSGDGEAYAEEKKKHRWG